MPTPQPSRKSTGKPKTASARKPAPKPGGGLMGWLGRQVGHVKKAVKTDVTKSQPGKRPPSAAAPKRPGNADPSPAPSPKIIYREDKIEEIDHPTQPGMKLRRTVIDEVIVAEETTKSERPN